MSSCSVNSFSSHWKNLHSRWSVRAIFPSRFKRIDIAGIHVLLHSFCGYEWFRGNTSRIYDVTKNGRRDVDVVALGVLRSVFLYCCIALTLSYLRLHSHLIDTVMFPMACLLSLKTNKQKIKKHDAYSIGDQFVQARIECQCALWPTDAK